MDNSLHWDLEEAREGLASINTLDLALTNLETLLRHGFVLWVEDGKLKYKAPQELQTSDRTRLLEMAAQCKSELVFIISDPKAVSKRLRDAQTALSEVFNHATVLEEDLERLSEILKRK
tara:strand:+ start:75 stop:431 length:357 start_codon:yes stop_codon:yes gene_type:complete